MSRSLLVSVAIALTCVGAGIGAFIAGRAGGPNLVWVSRDGSQAGTQAGVRAGSTAGARAGYHVGYRAGYHHAYPSAYRTAYRRLLDR